MVKRILHNILLIFNLLAALALVLSTLGGAMSPSHHVWPSLLAFAYLPLLVLNVLLALVWVLLRKWPFLISVAAIVARWSFVGLFVQLHGTSAVPSREENPQMLVVMSYNVHQFQGRDNEPQHSDSVAQLFLGEVDRYRPDVLCLQEYAAPRRIGLIDSLLLRGYNHYYGSHTSSKGQPYGSVVFSRLPITYVNRIDGEKLMVELLHDSGRVRCCCMHLPSYRFDDLDRQGIEKMAHGEIDGSARRTLDKVKETMRRHEQEWERHIAPMVEAEGVPMVVAGDMNDIASSWLYSRMTRRLSDAFCEQGTGLSVTYNGGFPQFRIDMVFHNKGLRTLSYKRVRSQLSDHYPLVVAFNIES